MSITILPPWSVDPPTSEEISLVAYAIYLEKGSRDGHDLDDWLEAERRLMVEFRNAALQARAVDQYGNGKPRQLYTRPIPDRRRAPRPVVPTYLPV